VLLLAAAFVAGRRLGRTATATAGARHLVAAVPVLCESPTLSAYTEADIARIDNRTAAWEAGLSRAMKLESDALHLRSAGSTGWQKGATIWDELHPLVEPGCLPQKRTDRLGHDNRHPFNMWEPTAACVDPQVLGGADADGARTLCSFQRAFKDREPCIVYSIGSNGDFAFEDALLALADRCIVHTMDCTMSGRFTASFEVKPRLWFHPWCLSGVDGLPDARFKSLRGIHDALGHSWGSLALLKMDVEAYEHAVLESWDATDPLLPEQLSVEVHCTTEPRSGVYRYRSAGELTLLLLQLLRVGYRLTGVSWEGGGIGASMVRLRCPSGK